MSLFGTLNFFAYVTITLLWFEYDISDSIDLRVKISYILDEGNVVVKYIWKNCFEEKPYDSFII